jgi:hypothetical protein
MPLEIYPELSSREAKQERGFLRKVIAVLGALCFVLLFALAATWPTKAYSQDIPLHVLDKDGVNIKLMGTPCVDAPSMSMIRPDALSRFKAIESVWPEKDGSRKAYGGCWTELTAAESGSVDGFLLVFADGASGFVPKSEFRKVRGQVGV